MKVLDSNNTGPGGAPFASYRGAWSATTPRYYAGDLVTTGNQLYSANADIPVLSYVGSSNGLSGTIKTTAYNLPLPTGKQAGDLAVVALGLQTLSASTTTAFYTAPSWGTTLGTSVLNNSTNANTYMVFDVRYYTLTATDVTNGYLTIPAQTNAGNSANATIWGTAMVFRNAAVDTGQVALGTVATGTSTTASATTGGGMSNTNVSEYVIWAGAMAANTSVSVGTPSYTGGAGAASATDQAMTNNGTVGFAGGTSLAYRDALNQEGTFNAVTIAETLGGSTPWAALGLLVPIQAAGTFTASNWTQLTSSLGVYEEVSLSAQTMASAAVTTLTNFTSVYIRSAYASGFNLTSGTWTCPATDIYEILVSVAFTAWSGSSLVLATIGRNGTSTANQLAKAEYTTAANDGRVFAVARKRLVAGDVITFSAYQNTGVSQTIATGERSYISISRVSV